MDINDWVCLLVARAHDTAMFRCLVIMNMRFEYECYSNQYEKRKHTCASSLSFRSAEMLSDTWTICHDTGVWMWMGLCLHINDSFACITHTHTADSLDRYKNITFFLTAEFFPYVVTIFCLFGSTAIWNVRLASVPVIKLNYYGWDWESVTVCICNTSS